MGPASFPAALLPLVGTPVGPSLEGQCGTPALRPLVPSGAVGRAEGPRGQGCEPGAQDGPGLSPPPSMLAVFSGAHFSRLTVTIQLGCPFLLGLDWDPWCHSWSAVCTPFDSTCGL